MVFVAKAQGIEHTLFSEDTSSFFRLKFEPHFEALLLLFQKIWERRVNPWKKKNYI